jgi:lactoylglutathione lyase
MAANNVHISGFGINVDDLDRSAEFYTKALGLQEKMKLDLGEMHEVMVAGEGDSASILLVKHSERTGAPESGSGYEKIVLLTDDVDAAHERAAANGGTSVKEPWDLAKMGIRVALVRDPDGYLIELIQQQS